MSTYLTTLNFLKYLCSCLALGEYADFKLMVMKLENITLICMPSGGILKQGQVIGYAGGTDVSRPHLHFQLNDITNPNKKPVDPVQYMKYTREAMYDIRLLREVFHVPTDPKAVIFKETIGKCPGGN